MEKYLTTVSEKSDVDLKQHKREEQDSVNLSTERLLQGEVDTLDMCSSLDESNSCNNDSGDADGIGGYMFNYNILTDRFGCDSLCDGPDPMSEFFMKLNKKLKGD